MKIENFVYFQHFDEFFPQFQFSLSNQKFLVCLFLEFWRVFQAHQVYSNSSSHATISARSSIILLFKIQPSNSKFVWIIIVNNAASWCSSIYFASIAVERETVWKLEPPRNDFISAAPTLTSDNLEGQKKGSLAWNDTITTSVWPSVSVREQSEREREKRKPSHYWARHATAPIMWPFFLSFYPFSSCMEAAIAIIKVYYF